MRKMDKDDKGCLIWVIAIVLINAIGIYFVRTNETIKGIVEGGFLGVFFFVFIVSILLSAIKGKPGDFFQDVAGYSRFVMLAFIPIYIASIIK